MLIYARHRENFKYSTLMIYENTKGKTGYRLSEFCSFKDKDYTGHGCYVIGVRYVDFHKHLRFLTSEHYFHVPLSRKISNKLTDLLDNCIKLFD